MLAVVTVFLQLDLQAASNPTLAPLVPVPARGYAQTQIAALADESDNGSLALAEARRLVRRRAAPTAHLTLLAIAMIKAGQAEQAGTTIQIAGQRGWRVPVAQEAALRLALAARDKPEAARHYVALLLCAATLNELLQEVGPAVLDATDGAGRRTLVDIISGTDRWNEACLRPGTQVMTPSTFTDIAAATMARGTRFDCAVLAQTDKGLAQRDVASAQRFEAAIGNRCDDPVS